MKVYLLFERYAFESWYMVGAFWSQDEAFSFATNLDAWKYGHVKVEEWNPSADGGTSIEVQL